MCCSKLFQDAYLRVSFQASSGMRIRGHRHSRLR